MPRISAPICLVNGTTSNLVLLPTATSMALLSVCSASAVNARTPLFVLTRGLFGGDRNGGRGGAMPHIAARQRRQDALDQGARRLGAQLDGDAVASAFAFIGEVDGEHVIERRVIRMVVIDVRGVDPHPALTTLGAADQRRLFDDVRG